MFYSFLILEVLEVLELLEVVEVVEVVEVLAIISQLCSARISEMSRLGVWGEPGISIDRPERL